MRTCVKVMKGLSAKVGSCGAAVECFEEFDVDVEEFVKFIKTAAHQFLYKFGPYPSGYFSQVSYEGLPLFECRHTDIVRYVDLSMQAVRRGVCFSKLSEIRLSLFDRNQTPLLEYHIRVRNKEPPKKEPNQLRCRLSYISNIRSSFRRALVELNQHHLSNDLMRELHGKETRFTIHLRPTEEVLEATELGSRVEWINGPSANEQILPVVHGCGNPESTETLSMSFWMKYANQ